MSGLEKQLFCSAKKRQTFYYHYLQILWWSC